jgi:glycosyltransferase involved in cell wall biosynthesis
MRVLHIIPSVADVRGGPSRVISLMERHLSGAGVDVTTVTTDDGGKGRRLDREACRANGQPSERVYFRKWSEFYLFAPGMLPWLWQNVRNFDVVHIHALFSFTSVAAALLASQRGVPYVVRPLGVLNRYGITQRRPWLKTLSLAAIEGPVLRGAAAVHFTSEAERDEASVLNIPMRGVVIPLMAEIEDEAGPDPLEDRPALRGRKLVLFLSRLDPKKNLEGLIDAFAASESLRRGAALLVAGSGEVAYVDSLKARAQKAGIADLVVWLGHVEGGRKAALLAAADIFALPSHSENFGIAAVEAMLAGLPVVLGEGVAISRDVDAAGGGIAVTVDRESIAAALERLLENEAMRRDMGTRALSFA